MAFLIFSYNYHIDSGLKTWKKTSGQILEVNLGDYEKWELKYNTTVTLQKPEFRRKDNWGINVIYHYNVGNDKYENSRVYSDKSYDSTPINKGGTPLEAYNMLRTTHNIFVYYNTNNPHESYLIYKEAPLLYNLLYTACALFIIGFSLLIFSKTSN